MTFVIDYKNHISTAQIILENTFCYIQVFFRNY